MIHGHRSARSGWRRGSGRPPAGLHPAATRTGDGDLTSYAGLHPGVGTTTGGGEF